VFGEGLTTGCVEIGCPLITPTLYTENSVIASDEIHKL
jgi:hypothetical protein